MKQSPEVMKRREAAQYLRIGLSTLDAMVKAKRIPFVRLSGHGLKGVIRFRLDALRAWLEREEGKVASTPFRGLRQIPRTVKGDDL